MIEKNLRLGLSYAQASANANRAALKAREAAQAKNPEATEEELGLIAHNAYNERMRYYED